MRTEPLRFVLENTEIVSPPHVPEIRLHLASEIHDLWHKTEDELQQLGLPPPFWAFAWAGGQGLARYVLDHPETVRGKRVLDFASGSGIVAIAAKMAGAARVTAVDIDPWALAAVAVNASANAVEVDCFQGDVVGTEPDAEVLLAGDVFYDREFADAILPWFEQLAPSREVIVGDPGRAYFPKSRMMLLATYEVPVTRVLEDSDVKKTKVWRFDGKPAPVRAG